MKVVCPHMCVGGGMAVFVHRGFSVPVAAVHNYISFGRFGYHIFGNLNICVACFLASDLS